MPNKYYVVCVRKRDGKSKARILGAPHENRTSAITIAERVQRSKGPEYDVTVRTQNVTKRG